VTRLRASAARLRERMTRVVLALMLGTLGTAFASSYTYDANHYNRYVSYGSWWTHSTMTNSTASWVTWRVSFSTRHCVDVTGAVTLAIEARVASSRSYCTTSSRDMSTAIPPSSSAAMKQRAVLHYDYYHVRKIDRYTGRVVDSGYATRKDSFTDYAFSSHY
jgi:hypothetical protein